MTQKIQSNPVFAVFGITLSLILSPQPSIPAQVIPDTTLSTTVTSSDNLNFLIEGGEECCTQAGQRINRNLFHSFEQFSVPANGAAIFNHASDIENIFSRVTGGGISDIQGQIATNGTANLFLINPSGIIFGEDASLNIRGSFFASTAESLIFGTDAEFSAIAPTSTVPLLSVNVSPGLQMGQRSGAITIQGRGHQLTGGLFFPTLLNDTPVGLQVAQNQTLGLIAAEITLSGGVLRTPGAHVSLHSIEEGLVELEPIENGTSGWQMDVAQVQEFGEIHLTDQALVDTSGSITGQVELYGGTIRLDEGSVVLIQNLGNQPSESIIVTATDTLILEDSIRNAPDQESLFGPVTGVISSRLLTETLGAGQGGELLVSSQDLTLTDGSQIASTSYGEGASGRGLVNVAQSLVIDGSSDLEPDLSSGIATIAANIGSAGDLFVSSRNMSLSNGGVLTSLTIDSAGGNINLTVDEDLSIRGFSLANQLPTRIGSSTFGKGQGGDVVVNASRIFIDDGADILSFTTAAGFAGDITVNASESIALQSGENPGIAGQSSIFTEGRTINLEFLEQIGLSELPTGDSGNVRINTPTLLVDGNSDVSVSNLGFGNSGELHIQANRIVVSDGGQISAFSQSGQGGNINLISQEYLILQNQGQIQAGSRGEDTTRQSSVNGGNIRVQSPVIVGNNNSDILANAIIGNGGQISIEAQALFGLEFRDRPTPDNDITASSEFGISGSVNINTLKTDPDSRLIELPTNLVDPSNQITKQCADDQRNSFTAVGRGGLPIDANAQRPWGAILPDFGMIPVAEHRDFSTIDDNLSIPLPHVERDPVGNPRQLSIRTSLRHEATEMRVMSTGDVQLVAPRYQETSRFHPSCLATS